MRKIFSAAVIVLLSAIAVSCNKVNAPVTEGEGCLTLGVKMDAATKAAMSSDELLSSAIVNIYYADFSGLIRSYKYSEIPETIYLPANTYRCDVIAGEASKDAPAYASWEQKSYKGSKEFTITPGVNTNVEVLAKVNNAISKITFDPTVDENFTDYTLTIGIGENTLVYDSTKSGSEGYFIVAGLVEPQFEWTFEGTLAKDGSTFTKSATIEEIAEPGKTYALTLRYTIKDGDISFELLVDYSTDVVDDTIIFEPVSTGLAASSIYEIWAGHATVHADVDATEYPDPTAVKFAYSADGVNWTTVDSNCTSEGVYEATLTGLQGGTEYTYKLVVAGEDVGDPMTFTTEAAPAIPNGSFEHYSTVSGASYYKFYDPSCDDPTCQTMWWGSGNGEGSEGVNGSASMGIVITTIDTGVVGAHSVLAQSGSTLGMLAAGNIFTGNFDGLVGTSGGRVNFGRPWTARPTALRLWVKYTASKMNIIKGQPAGANISTSVYDRCQISVALGTWSYKTYGGTKDSPIKVNTTDASTFVNYYTDSNTIANGELIVFGNGIQKINGGEETSVANAEWRQITIPINYHTTTAYPTHVVISCAASMYGDYFSGSDDAKLWLDGVEFLYE
ncbi:MAG: DUF4493 domain-containing protein [Bacteroidales bacterium]|nr:DUF4493 domain-containing protein [Bacteroidales bacterium]